MNTKYRLSSTATIFTVFAFLQFSQAKLNFGEVLLKSDNLRETLDHKNERMHGGRFHPTDDNKLAKVNKNQNELHTFMESFQKTENPMVNDENQVPIISTQIQSESEQSQSLSFDNSQADGSILGEIQRQSNSLSSETASDVSSISRIRRASPLLPKGRPKSAGKKLVGGVSKISKKTATKTSQKTSRKGLPSAKKTQKISYATNPKKITIGKNTKKEKPKSFFKATVIDRKINPRNQRLECVTCRIEKVPKEEATGSKTNAKARSFAKAMGHSSDHAGHAIAAQNGGSGTDTGNIIPLGAKANLRMRDFESKANRFARTDGVVVQKIIVKYKGDSTRPKSVKSIITRVQGKGDLKNKTYRDSIKNTKIIPAKSKGSGDKTY